MGKFSERFLGRADKSRENGKSQDLYIYESKQGLTTILVTTLGLHADLLDEIIVTTKAKLPARNDRLVYLTDNSDFAIFRRHGVIFEYIPPLVEQRLHAADMPWQAYLQERWGLLLAKWRPRRILAYGTNIDSFLAAAPKPATHKPAGPPRS